MKVKEVYVEAKKSKNYQTYTVGFTAEVGFDDDETVVVKELQARARKLCAEQLELD